MPEKSEVYLDHDLGIEACYFQNMFQKFPSHTHNYYVIGLIERGQRQLTYRTSRYMLFPQNLLLINPGDSHCCISANTDPLYYRAIHIPIPTMQALLNIVTTDDQMPLFSTPIVNEPDLSDIFVKLHVLIMNHNSDSKDKKSNLISFVNLLFKHFTQSKKPPIACTPKVSQAQKYLDENYKKNITIKDLYTQINIKPTTLFICFMKDLGISPRRYLITKRVNAAKELLPTMDVNLAAIEAGFFDHSHFTRAFKALTGFTPKQYKNCLLRSNR